MPVTRKILAPSPLPHPSGPTQPALGFEASMYPHLVDLIFIHADGLDLLHLRTACHAWFKRANAALSIHITAIEGTAYAVGAAGDLVRHPAFVPSLRPKPGAQRRGATTKVNWTHAMSSVKVVDLIDRHKYYTAKGFPQVRPSLRLWESIKDCGSLYTTAPKADTIVLFAWPSPRVNETGLAGPLWTPFRSIQLSTRKLVVNVSPASTTRRPSNAHVLQWSGLNEMVINVVVPPSPEHPSSGTHKPETATWGRLPHLLRWAPNSLTQVTFVNTAAVPRSILAGLLARDKETEWKRFYPATWAAFKTANTFQEAAEAHFEEVRRSGFTPREALFLTSAEYEAKVGTETYRIETMEEPWRV
jgi:hypothetical protein